VIGARSHGLWGRTAPSAPATHPLRGDIKADIAVVGGGYAGLSSALHLAEAGAKVVLLEAAEIGYGGAGRNVGLVNAGLWVMPDAVVQGLGKEYGSRLIQLLGGAPERVFGLIEKHRIACEAQRAGTLHCAVGAKGLRELEARAAQWQKLGAPVELLDADAAASRIGSRAYCAALLDKRAGTVQPLAYARGLAHAAMRAEARLFTDSKVTGTERAGNGWILRTGEGSVTADWIIVATDAYSAGPWAALRAEQVHLPYFNLATKPLAHEEILPERQGAWDTREILSSFRRDAAGRLVFGSVGALEGTGAAIHRAWAIRALRRIFPQIGEIEFEAAWFGMIGMTSDNLPRLHQLDDKVVSVSGYNGRGIAPGTVFGKVLADFVLGATTLDDLPLPPTAIARPALRALKEHFYRAGSQLAHLAGDRL